MKNGSWSVAFTIIFEGTQVDFMELPMENRIQILQDLVIGETQGILRKEERCYGKTAS